MTVSVPWVSLQCPRHTLLEHRLTLLALALFVSRDLSFSIYTKLTVYSISLINSMEYNHSFLRSKPSLSYSRNPGYFIETQSSLPRWLLSCVLWRGQADSCICRCGYRQDSKESFDITSSSPDSNISTIRIRKVSLPIVPTRQQTGGVQSCSRLGVKENNFYAVRNQTPIVHSTVSHIQREIFGLFIINTGCK